MSTVAEIKQAISELPETDYVQLRRWFLDLDWEKWDRQIEEDAATGRLDFLASEVFEARENGTLQEL